MCCPLAAFFRFLSLTLTTQGFLLQLTLAALFSLLNLTLQALEFLLTRSLFLRCLFFGFLTSLGLVKRTLGFSGCLLGGLSCCSKARFHELKRRLIVDCIAVAREQGG